VGNVPEPRRDGDPMRVNRRLLYWGVVLVAIGGVLVAADLGAIDTAALTDALRLWPLAVVAIGLSLVLRRTRFSLPALLAAALIPGLVVGAAFAVAPRFAGNCGARGDVAGVAADEGAFVGPATVVVRSGCGVLHVSTASGNAWSFEAGSTSQVRPDVVSSDRALTIKGSGNGLNLLDASRDEWNLTLPRSDLTSLTLAVTTGDARADLSGAWIGDLSLTANAARMTVDASAAASVRTVSGVVNAGAMSLSLPASSDITGSLKVGAGKLDICTAPGLGLRVTSRDTGGSVSVAGLEQTGSVWESDDYRTAPHRADLNVHVTFGAVDINPIGECE
jgi:hypothetical protein